jgi:hypothetical protein
LNVKREKNTQTQTHKHKHTNTNTQTQTQTYTLHDERATYRNLKHNFFFLFAN